MFHIESYTTACWLFTRLLGIIYCIALFPFLFQIRGLIGKHGILPISQLLHVYRCFLPKQYYRKIPSIFWINSSDCFLLATVSIGIVFALLLVFGIYPSLCLAILYIIYLSIVSTGQDFLGFGWESFLLELTVNTFFLTLTPEPNFIAWLSINFLLFRFHLQAGAVKLQSKDPNWKNLTACSYHYQTQPLPNTIAWYAHKLPLWFHKTSCALMFFIELAVPFAIFFDENLRLLAYGMLVGLQIMIWSTGNFSYLNYMTVAFCTILLNNNTLDLLNLSSPSPLQESETLNIIATSCASILLLLQVAQLKHHFFPTQFLHTLFNKIRAFHLINPYGIFAIMTTKRYEIVIEGSYDQQEWREYALPYKPSECQRRPRRISPYQPRLDWQMWFLPFSSFSQEDWFQKFLSHLLQGTQEVLKLIRYNPFPDRPPTYIRALVYDYTFSTWTQKKETGIWWQRRCIGNYTQILTKCKK